MLKRPQWCGQIAEPFPNKEAYYCDFCGNRPPDGTKLRWFTPSSVICDQMSCHVIATDEWELHCTMNQNSA